MTGFGKRLDGPGGRRRAQREPVLLNAALLALGCSRAVTLVDVSRTGARMTLPEPMRRGQQVWLKLPDTEVFGSVKWIDGDSCGIAFDSPLDDRELALLRAKGRFVLVHGLAPEEQMALEDWKAGLAR